ncbi:hypothetical protein N7535_009284 [Penicillium sp. DV-2018c]|nr:hypothetical protein N7461_002806 [Penicillium sp. DV-2018c]KAJ5561087.1 hypothetical protein N7535_009284 [Penicillium sp. DV-2018c]
MASFNSSRYYFISTRHLPTPFKPNGPHQSSFNLPSLLELFPGREAWLAGLSGHLPTMEPLDFRCDPYYLDKHPHMLEGLRWLARGDAVRRGAAPITRDTPIDDPLSGLPMQYREDPAPFRPMHNPLNTSMYSPSPMYSHKYNPSYNPMYNMENPFQYGEAASPPASIEVEDSLPGSPVYR